jgi:tetratricopeptide (TPR) repeat protein
MKKTTVLLSFTLLVGLGLGFAREEANVGEAAGLAPVRAMAAPPQAAKQPQWKSREEYDAFSAMAAERDPQKKISLAEAFLAKFANSDFKANAYILMAQTYQQLGQGDKAVDAGRKALEADPDNLDALSYLSYAFPFIFKADDPDATTKLSRAESDARHGLEVLGKLQKPANVPEDQFNQAVKARRAVFNSAIGFVALQRKDYAGALAALKLAAEDNPSDVYTFYRMGLAYLYSTPPDYSPALWYMARAVSLAKASQNPAGPEIEKFLKRAYINYHGNEEGLPDLINQAASSVNPPEGFKVEAMKIPEKTGNPNIDNFNDLATPLKLGGERAQKLWDGIKGQDIGLGGYVDSIVPGTEPGTFLVHIDILDQSKAAEGVYDIELKDSTQPNVKNLSKGEIVRFHGKIDSYTVTPSFVLTVVGTIIDPDPLPEAVKEKPKPKPAPKPTPRRRATSRATSVKKPAR